MHPSLFQSAPMVVRPEWIDFNGHLNMAYYNVLFDHCADEVHEQLGFGPDYQKTGFTTYTAEFHLCYLRELYVNAPVTVTLHLVDYDEKRLHTYQEIHHADGWVAATGEAMTLHIDQSGPKVAPMPENILSRVAAMFAAHQEIPKPDRLGRSIGIRRQGKAT
ncbi:MAG: thioesterase family protein [Roseobacter sp.]